MEINPLAKPQRDLGRITEIVTTLLRYGLADWLKPIPLGFIQDFFKSKHGEVIADEPIAVRLRMAAVELGPTFVKLGQLLSTRPDLVGAEVALQLSQLQASTPAAPCDEIREILETHLLAAPEQVFASFEWTPFASASIAQVHMAELHNGDQVVVKVQKPAIRKKIEADLSILKWLAELVEKYSLNIRNYQPARVVVQFSRAMMRELDFEHERRNLEEFAYRFRHSSKVVFPKTYVDYSSSKVLTMQYLEGIAANQIDALQLQEYDLKAIALQGAEVFLEMIFRDRFYHADPHPGNIMILPDGKIGILDCGLTGRLDEKTSEEIENMLLAVARGEVQDLAAAVKRITSSMGEADHESLTVDLGEFVADYAGRPFKEIDLTSAIKQLISIVRNHQLMLPPSASLLLRTLILLDGSAQQLNPQFSLSEVIRPFYMKILRQRLHPKRLATRMQRTMRDWEHFLQSLPTDLGEVLSRIRSGKFHMHLDHRHLDPVINRLVLGIVVASVFLGSSLLWSMKAPPMLWGVSIFGALGYLVALYWGWRLFRAMRKSGNIFSKDD